MNYMASLTLLAGVWLLAIISPGPDFAATVQYATARSRREGIMVALGITSAIAIWIVGSMLGMGILMARLSWLVELMRIGGALYLIYLGVRSIMSAHRAAPEKVDIVPQKSGLSAWRVGFITNISNPKAVVFFSSLFVVILPANPPLWLQVASAALMLVMAAGWFCIVACLFSLAPITRAYRHTKRWIDYVTGGIFIALGIRLAVER
ncbi:LysE family translocator [Ktedonospora formicarum]|uniref:Threonine transporter n=1 Tax=Ktedonospora formicarum TaxID=2778364 RepID=A0A8J3I3M8_9CHLR|nr:LysE family transporter [Ktedonospora formicarum]GHO49562.1 threonine transporter [Ktedonospora formicarum]